MRMRKKKRGAERLFALSSIICDNLTINEPLSDIFEKNHPLRLEIGCGKGDFVCGMSKREPDYNYFAMEKVNDVIVVAAEKYAKDRGLGKMSPHGLWITYDGREIQDGEKWDIPLDKCGNVRFIPGDATNLSEMFAPGTFETIYANFSDPWPKKGCENRRLTAPAFLKTYLELLAPGGYFKFKTDNVQLFDYSLETVEASDFELLYYTRDLHNSERNADNIQTEYERNFSAKGFTINYLEARKK